MTSAATALLAACVRAPAFGVGARKDFDYVYATAREMAAAIRRRQISSRELVQATFQRIDRYNPRINAIVVQFRDRALARAREADEALANGKIWGPLHGVPITIKEAFAYAGSPSTWGRPELKDALSVRTAVAVERLESSGAIVIAKTNIPTGLSDIQSYNAIYGATNNPWDLTRTPGGSTGGGAAAIAAGFGPLTLGSDSGGSIRTPAHLCGVYAHKPTVNLVSLAGHTPGSWDGKPPLRSFDFDVAGPLARDAQDLALALNVLGGPVGDEATAWSWTMPTPRHKRLRDFRIGYVIGQSIVSAPEGAPLHDIAGLGFAAPNDPVASDLHEVYENLLSALARSGAKLEQGWPVGIDFRSQLETFLYLVRSRVDPGEEQLKRYRQRLNENPNNLLALALAGPHSRWLVEAERVLGFRAAWQAYFRNYDVFLLPAAATVAFPHDHSEPFWERRIATPGGKVTTEDFNYWSVFATLAGLPATVAPVGRTRSGLPAGIQIIAPMWEDGTSIEFAALLADLVGGFVPPPGYESL